MKEKMKKFGAWLLAAALAFAGATANADAVKTTDEFKTAIANAKSGDVITLAAGEFDASATSSFGPLAGKTVSIIGAGREQTTILWGSGRQYNMDGAKLTFKDLAIQTSQNFNGQTKDYTDAFERTASETYENVAVKGRISVVSALATFSGCTFDGIHGEEYLLWVYAGKAVVDGCTFKTCTKAPIKCFADLQSNNPMISLEVKGNTKFEVNGSKGCAVYSSNRHTETIFDVRIDESTVTPPTGATAYVKASEPGVSVYNGTKDESGKYVSGTFMSANSDAATAKALIEKFVAEGVEVPELVNGQVVIEGGEKPTAVAKVIDAEGNEKEYETLAAAVSAAKSGETVKLLADFEDIGTVTLPAGVTIDGLDGETKHTITGASGFFIPEAGGCAIKNIQFVDIHNNSVWPEGDIASYGKDYGVSSGYVGTQSAIVATPLKGELEVRGCYFNNVDWDAIQITGEASLNTATIRIIDNEFRHTNETTAQLRYIHFQSADSTAGSHPTVVITDNRFYNTRYAYPVLNIGLWDATVTALAGNSIDLHGNWFENTANVVVHDNAWLNPMRSQPDVDVDDKSFVAQIDQSGSIVIGQYFSVRDAVIAANKLSAEAKWSSAVDFIQITLLAGETLSEPLVVNNVNGVKIKISASSYTLTANGCDLVHAKTPVYLSGRFACDTVGKYLIDVDEGATGQFSGSTEAKTCGSFNGSVVVEGPVNACFDSDITHFQSNPHFYGKWYLNQPEEDTWQIVAYTDATAKDAGLPIKASQVTIDGMSGTRYFATLSDLSERATKFNTTISLVGDVSLAEGEGDLPSGKTIELKNYTISGPVESAGSLTILSSSSTPNQTFDFIKTTDAGLTLGKSSQKYDTEAVIKDADIGTILMIYRSFKKVTIEGGRYKSSEKVATLYTYSSEKSELVVKGGIFGSDQVYDYTGKVYLPLSDFVPEGYEVVANQDEATKATYPWTVQEKAESPYWSDHAAAEYSTPVDTENKILTIATAEELALFAKEVNEKTNPYNDYTINITKDIDLSDYEWVSIKARQENKQTSDFYYALDDAVIDGGNHAITGMKIANVGDDEYGIGFLGEAMSLRIKDLAFDEASIDLDTERSQVGIVIGALNGAGMIENVHVMNSTLTAGWHCGAIIGFTPSNGNTSYIRNCTCEGVVVTDGYSSPVGTIYSGVMVGCVHQSDTVVFADGTRIKNDCSVTAGKEFIGRKIGGVSLGKMSEVDGWWYPTLADGIKAVAEDGEFKLLANCAEEIATDRTTGFTMRLADGVAFTGKVTGPDGYELKPNDDGTYTYGEAKTYVAEIVETGKGYQTLQAAVEDAAVGQTVKLLANVEECIVVAEGKDITLDLNGKMIDAKNVPNGSALKNLGKVTVTDSSEEKTGILARKDLGGNNVWYVINNEGEMVIDYANVTNICGTAYDSEHASLIENCGTLTIEDGYFSQPYPVVKNEPTGELTINGGTFTVAGMTVGKEVVQFYGTVEINGGSYDGTIKIEAGVDLAIKGGTFLGSDTVNKDLKRYGADGWYDVITDITSGGMMTHTFVKEIPEAPAAWLVANYAVPSYYCGDVVAANQAVKSWVADGYKSKDESEVLHLAVTPTSPKEIAEGVYHAVYEDGVEVGSAVTPATGIELKTTYDESTGVYTYEAVPSVGACIIKPNGEIVNYNVGSSSAVKNAATAATAGDTVKVLQDDVDLSSSASYFYNNANTPLTLDLNGKTIGRMAGSAYKTISINKPITLTIVDGEGTGTVNQGVYVTVADGKAVIKGGIYKGALYTSNGGQIIVQGGTFYNNPTAFVDEDNYDVIENATEPKTWTVQAKAVCQIGETKYPSIAAAVEAVPAGVETTITVIADHKVSFDGEYSVNVVAGKNVIIDLNGHAIDVTATRAGATEFIKNNGQLTICDSAAKVEGHFAGSISFTATNPDTASTPTYGSDVILNQSGTLVVAGGKLFNKSPNGACYVIDNNSGVGDTFLTVNDGELIATGSSCVRLVDFNEAGVYKNDLTINGAYFQAKYYDLRLQTKGAAAHVVVKGGEFYATDATYNCGICVVSDTTAATVVDVSGGKFNSRISGKAATMALTGGIYAYDKYVDGSKPAELLSSFVAEGYEVQANVEPFTKDDYPYAVAKKAFVPAEDPETGKVEPITIDITPKGGETQAIVPVKVSEVAVAEMVEKGIIAKPEEGEKPTAAEVSEGLAKKQENDQTVWQNYVMGIDGTTEQNVLATIGEKRADKPEEVVVVKTPITEFNPPQNTGVTVTYNLLRKRPGETKFSVFQEGLLKPEVDVNTIELDVGDTLWKFEAVFSAEKP